MACRFTVVVATFELLQPLLLLDLTALADVYHHGSIFDPKTSNMEAKAHFLRTLSGRMTRVIMPNDQSTEYLVTQVVADYLAARAEPPLDGVAFSSTQTFEDDLNIALFHKSSRVEALPVGNQIERDVSISYSDEDGEYPSFTIWETVSKAEDEKPPEPELNHTISVFDTFLRYAWDEPIDPDSREVKLRLSKEKIKVHIIGAVNYQSDVHDVSWHRTKKTTDKY